MSRIRTVKPELFRHEDLFEAEIESGLPLRLSFIGLFTVADCEGRFRWRPRTLKLDVLPHDTIDFAAVLNELEKNGFIRRYQVGGETFGWIPNFKRHQRIQTKEIEAGSALPPPPEQQNAPGTHPVRTQERTSTLPESQEGKGMERKGIENTPPSFFSETPPASARVAESMPETPKKEKKADEWNRDSRNKPIPADWEPQSATLDITAGLGIPIGFVENQAPLFRLHHMEAGTQRGGFESLFVGWCKKAWALKAEERSPGERRKGETMLEHSQRLRRMYLEPDQPGERLLEGEVIRAH